MKSSAASGNQWYVNGTQISGATGQFLHPTISSTYRVQATENGCISPMSDGFAYTVTAIIDPTAFGGQVYVLPNPVTDRIIIVNKLNHPLDIKLYDVTGKLLIATNVPLGSTKSLLVSNLRKGIYMMLVTDVKANKSFQKTLLKL